MSNPLSYASPSRLDLTATPNVPAAQAASAVAGNVRNAGHQNGFSLYPDKNFELADKQVPNTSQLADKIVNVVDAQIENEVKSENSTHVLNNLITSLAGCAVPSKIKDPTTVDGVHAGAEAGVTAARTFAHSLLHIIDDGLVWMDATQVNSTARTDFDFDMFNRNIANLTNKIQRSSNGNYNFGQFWNGLSRSGQIQFVRSLIRAYDANQYRNGGATNASIVDGQVVLDEVTGPCPSDNGTLNAVGTAGAGNIARICEQLTNLTRGGGGSQAFSGQELCDTLYGAVRSSTDTQAQSTVFSQITPSFITNSCVYYKLFMRLQQGVVTDGNNLNALAAGGASWGSPDSPTPNTGPNALPAASAQNAGSQELTTGISGASGVESCGSLNSPFNGASYDDELSKLLNCSDCPLGDCTDLADGLDSELGAADPGISQ